MKTLIVVCSLLISVCSYAQNEAANREFEKAKGKLDNPVKYLTRMPIPKSLDTTQAAKMAVYNGYKLDTVRAIFDGEVVTVDRSGDYYIVTKYGDYTIAYFGIPKPDLKVGDKVKKGQVIAPCQYKFNFTSLILTLFYKEEEQLTALEWLKK